MKLLAHRVQLPAAEGRGNLDTPITTIYDLKSGRGG